MTERLKSNLTMAQFLIGLAVAMIPAGISIGMFVAAHDAQGQSISKLEREQERRTEEWRDWRDGVDADRSAAKAYQTEILRRLDRIEAKLDR